VHIKSLLTVKLKSISIIKNNNNKGFDEEEYIYSRIKERGCWWKFPMIDVWKVASEQ
jgi:hypothetical protein